MFSQFNNNNNRSVQGLRLCCSFSLKLVKSKFSWHCIAGYLQFLLWFQTMICVSKISPWAPSWTERWWSSRWWSWWSCWGRCRAWQCGRRWLLCHWTCSCAPVPEERWELWQGKVSEESVVTWHSAKVESLENSSRQRMTLGMFRSRKMQTIAIEISAWREILYYEILQKLYNTQIYK